MADFPPQSVPIRWKISPALQCSQRAWYSDVRCRHKTAWVYDGVPFCGHHAPWASELRSP